MIEDYEPYLIVEEWLLEESAPYREGGHSSLPRQSFGVSRIPWYTSGFE